MDPLVQNISDTARWVAVFRAEESERPDAVFHDPFARRLAGKKGEQIADAIEFSRKNSWSFVARTFLFDKLIQQEVDSGMDMVINLAAGLDTRPYRMALSSSLQWVDVDFAGMIHYKQSVLAGEKPHCQLQSIPLDLSDRQARKTLFDRLEKNTRKALVVTEGLIIYLTAAEAGELAGDLAAHPKFRRWIFDLSSPAVLEMAKKEMEPTLKEGRVEFKFAPEEGEDFFQQHGWKWLVSYSKLKTAGELKRLSGEMMHYATMPEPQGPRRNFPWSGVCLFENKHPAPQI